LQVGARVEVNAREVASRLVEASHEADVDGVVTGRKHDGYRRSRRLGRRRCRISGGNNHGAMTTNQIGR